MAMTRRHFIKLAGVTAIGAAALGTGFFKRTQSVASAQAPVIGSQQVSGGTGARAKVYFTRHIDNAHLLQLYDKVNEGIVGKVGVKLHTGEKHGPNILPRTLVKALTDTLPNCAIVETNTMYPGDRYTTKGHRETLKVNGWNFCPVDILDEEGGVEFPVVGGKFLDHVTVGSHLPRYDSLIVFTHFKGHMMGGFGGSLKNIAIGCASGQKGKREVHGYLDGPMPPPNDAWVTTMPLKDDFMERMADSGKAVVDHFGKHITFLNVLRNMSVDCDCAGTSAAPPVLPDIGMLASTDILAADQASVDLVYNADAKLSHDLRERMESRHGLAQLTAMKERKMGNDYYELISIDDV